MAGWAIFIPSTRLLPKAGGREQLNAHQVDLAVRRPVLRLRGLLRIRGRRTLGIGAFRHVFPDVQSDQQRPGRRRRPVPRRAVPGVDRREQRLPADRTFRQRGVLWQPLRLGHELHRRRLGRWPSSADRGLAPARVRRVLHPQSPGVAPHESAGLGQGMKISPRRSTRWGLFLY